MILLWIELRDPSSILGSALKWTDEFVIMCCACDCPQRCVTSLLLNISPSTSFRTNLSASSTHAQSILPMLGFVVRLRLQNIMDAEEPWMVLTKHHRSPFLMPLVSFYLSAQCHHEHRRMRSLQRTHQDFYSAGGEHVPHGGQRTRPQGVPPTQREHPDSTEVPELLLWPHPGPPGTPAVRQSNTFL